MAFTDQQIVVGDTTTFVQLARKNGATWDLSGGTVLLYLWQGTSTKGPFTATLSDPTAGEAQYTVATTVIDSPTTFAGSSGVPTAATYWYRQWKTTDAAGVVMWSDPQKFVVYSNRSSS